MFKKILSYSIITVILFSALPVSVFGDGLTGDQVDVFNSNVYYFDTEIGVACQAQAASSSTTPAQVGGDNQKTTYDFFVANGYSPAQAAGATGNFMVEATRAIDPNSLNSIGAYGIAQWYQSRRTSMVAWVTAEGKASNSISGQLDYVLHELNTGYVGFSSAYKKISDPKAAAQSWMDVYENPGDGSGPTRQKNAQEIFDKFSTTVVVPGQTATPGSSSGCTAASSSGSPDCATATGSAKILCEAKKYNGIFYTFGGGHQGYDNFRKVCPIASIPAAAAASSLATPGPCSTDCSSLVSMAVDEAFNKKFSWVVSGIINDTADWQAVSVGATQPGDVVTLGDHHVEIVDHVDTKTGAMFTFGSHSTGTRTGGMSSTVSYWEAAYHYKGSTN